MALAILTATATSAAAITLPDLPDRDGMSIKGYVHDGAMPIAGVHVSDGHSFATTESDGSYYLPSNPDAETVFVITPSGYNPECTDGLSRFWAPVDNSGRTTRADFVLTAVDDSSHKMLVLGDPQMRDDHDHGLFKSDALPDILATTQSLKESGADVGMLVLGDICFNNPETYPRYEAYWKGYNTPIYHVPGNHDKHIVSDPNAQAPEYKATFGPLYYSFNKGGIHYLMLDNIHVTGTDTYSAYPDEKQMEWIMKDLDLVEEGSRVIVCAHQPITWTVTSRNENARLLQRLDRYNTLILTAHKHLGRNLEKYYDNIEERIQTALCGAYWFGDCAKDGIDLGYYIYNIDDTDITWEYKPLKRDTDTALRINDPTINSDRSFTFLVNIFDWDSLWKVTYSVDGTDKGELSSLETYDPHAYRLYADHVKSWCRPVATKHIFPVRLPEGSRILEVTATDRFGQVLRSRYEIAPDEIPDRPDTEVKGFVRCDGEGVGGVIVTNGYDFATTNVFGIYYLPQNDKAEMVYIIPPAGYDPVTTDGIPAFFKTIGRKDKVFQADFELTATGDDERHRFLAIADPQMRGEHDYSLYESTAIPDIRSTLDDIRTDGIPCQALVLGDICFDSWDTYPRYLASLSGIPTPFYHIPGNHDKHIVTDANVSAAEYKAAFGPLYYAVNKGKVHYLMLDNINVTSRGAYDTAISDAAASWVSKYLAMVPKDNFIVLCVHQPVTNSKTTAEANKDLLLTLSKYRTIILSAHKHFGQNLGKYALSAAPDADIEERIHSALCGAYWYGDVAKDGTPLGYYVYDIDGTDISWQFKPLGDDDYGQITIHEPVPFGKRLKTDVNVYDYDSNWSVSWKLDGVDKGRMYNYEALDPRANALYADHEKTWCRPAMTKHLFYGYLNEGYSEIEVNATDRFGRTHTQVFSASAGISSTRTDSIHVSVDNRILRVASESDIASVRVLGLSGAVCAEGTTDSMDLSTLAAGVYVVKICMTDSSIVARKIALR